MFQGNAVQNFTTEWFLLMNLTKHLIQYYCTVQRLTQYAVEITKPIQRRILKEYISHD
jgi:hypothetical protein